MPDADATVSELKEQVREFCEARDWDRYHNAKELAIGISTEAGELLEEFRFKSEDEVDAMFDDADRREALTDEVADVFYFVLRLAQRYDIDLSEQLDRKMQVNAEKYPVDDAKGSNEKYTELDAE
ncbi:MAG: nucleotide pyrophosphohydrolase [Candidatus Nanohaloarchaea archaeon]